MERPDRFSPRLLGSVSGQSRPSRGVWCSSGGSSVVTGRRDRRRPAECLAFIHRFARSRYLMTKRSPRARQPSGLRPRAPPGFFFAANHSPTTGAPRALSSSRGRCVASESLTSLYTPRNFREIDDPLDSSSSLGSRPARPREPHLVLKYIYH